MGGDLRVIAASSVDSRTSGPAPRPGLVRQVAPVLDRRRAMRVIHYTLGLALLLGLISFAVAAEPARAVVSLSVSPALVELEAKPGGKGEQTVTVTNGGDDVLDLAIGVE